ncbi:hypothetical protein D3C72_2257650 [compost metagenome]
MPPMVTTVAAAFLSKRLKRPSLAVPKSSTRSLALKMASRKPARLPPMKISSPMAMGVSSYWKRAL